MKHHTLSILIGLTAPLMLLSGCKKESQPVAPHPDPATPTVTQDGKIILDEPVTLRIAVAPMRIVDPYAVQTRAAGLLDGDYAGMNLETEATVNTTGVNDPDPNWSQVQKGEWYLHDDGGDDWIRTLTIPELTRDTDYKVEGLVKHHLSGSFFTPIVPDSKEVKVTFYSVPEDGVITLFANALVTPNNPEQEMVDTYPTLEEPIINATHNYLRLRPLRLDNAELYLPYLVNDATVNNVPVINRELPRKPTLMDSRNLPMYGRVTDLRMEDGKLYGKQFDQTVPQEFYTIYLERAVAKVEVITDPISVAYPYDYYPEKFDWFDQIRPGTYVDYISLIPHNWDKIQETRAKYQEKIPYLRSGLQLASDINKNYDPDFAALEGGGKQCSFFIPENRPTTKDEQSTVRVSLSDFSYDASQSEGKHLKIAVPKDERHKKIFTLIFGDEVNGLYQIRRNTIYRLHLRFFDGKVQCDQGLKVLPWKIAEEQKYLIDPALDNEATFKPLSKEESSSGGTSNNNN